MLPASVLAGNTLILKLLDKANNSPIADAYIYVSDSNGKSTGTISDEEGIARLTLNQGE